MTVQDIVIKFLKENGYDGIYQPEAECGCGIEDFNPCEENCLGCKPGYKHYCKKCKIKEKCIFDAPDDSFCIRNIK